MQKILVVDDVAEIRLWLKLLLQKQGYEVVEADGGLKARTLLGKQNFDMIITDLQMPEFNGIELIKEAKSSQPKAKTLAMSGASGVNSAKFLLTEIAASGMDCCLQKPFSNDELLSTVKELLPSDALAQ